MARRPYIEQRKIKDEYAANATHSNDGGYRSHCPHYEPVGMDGRNDWFRWECRDCERTYISQRSEKRQRYYKCRDCGALHFVYKGFFSLPDRTNGSETVPLKPHEFEGMLYKAKIQYKPLDDGGNWYYGSPEWLQEKIQRDDYETVEHITEVKEDSD